MCKIITANLGLPINESCTSAGFCFEGEERYIEEDKSLCGVFKLNCT